ncbi:MAG TPA: helix-turn-helix transcriptional regulator [Streptosporangiaceae bacterium]|jgi:transcriptional regulator with XRE-family HTH domain|nr:helix-turn-helix transcriptional regulator [Streptosporangiaceae bacterium]
MTSLGLSGGPTALRILLGSQLRRLREGRGISAQEAARAIRGSESKISRIELGRNAVREIDVADLLSLYGVTDPAEREQMLSLASQANRPGWWYRYNDILPSWFQAYIGLEEAATSIRVYEPQFIPGLLQTEAYTSAVLNLGDIPDEEMERHVVLRKERQRRFVHGELRLWALLDEEVLRRPVAGPKVMREQLEHLLAASRKGNLVLQIIPRGVVGHAAPSGFSILRFGDAEMPDIVYVEQLTSALYLDKRPEVDRYLLAMERISIVAEEPRASAGIVQAILDEMGGTA